MSSVFRFSDDGGKTERRGALSIHTDWHAMWIDPADTDHFIIGDDGGIAITWDKGGTYDFPNTFPIGQFYAVSFDMSKPYRVCGGLQDNGTWCGPDTNALARGGRERELVQRRWRRWVLQRDGSDEPEHHLRRVAGRKRFASSC